MQRSSLPSFSAIIISLFLFPTLAQAEGDAYETMLDLSDEATELVLDGNFEVGAVTFRQAYQAFADPILLRNEMIAWYRAEDCQNALTPARAFLNTYEAEPQDRNDVQTVQRECHLRLAEEALDEEHQLLAAFHLDSVSTLIQDEDEEKYRELRSRLHQQSPMSSEAPVGADPVDGGFSHRDLGWIQVTAGVASIGAALAMHTVALDRQAQLAQLSNSDAPTDAIILQRRQEDWSSYQRTTRWAVPALYGLGGVALGSGIYFLLRGDTAPDTSFAITPGLSPQRVGLDFSARF